MTARARKPPTFTPAALRAWREGLGMSQEQLGDHLGLSQQAIGHYETGYRPIAPRTVVQVRALAAELKVAAP